MFILRLQMSRLSIISFLKQNSLVNQLYHTSSVCNKRRGPVSDIDLPELIADKPPTYYANIKEKLNRINYYDNPVNLVDIGFDKNSQCFENFVKVFNEQFGAKRKHLNYDDDVSLDEASKDIQFSDSDYFDFSSKYFFTEEYVNSTVSLAHHYAIFRDLFFKVPADLQTCLELISLNAKNEVNFRDLSNMQHFYFNPLVSINAEFSYQDGEDILCQRSHRGNLIYPEYGLNSPSIYINASAINGEFNTNVDSNDSSVGLYPSKDSGYYTLALVNLDSHFNDCGVCHWLLTNIHNENDQTKFETAIKYLPVYGIRGLGFHRYAFVLFRHKAKLTNLTKIDDFDLGKRKFNALKFMDSFDNMKPIGLTWFQTTWNDNCRDVFYNYLDMKSPTYEYIYPKQKEGFKQYQYPGRAPFNIYLDTFRDPKDISKSVLLERLKGINPFESYKTEKLYPSFEGRPKLPQIHPISKEVPDWMKHGIRKMRAHVGRYRGLRAASAILPYNNNADLDKPLWPRANSDVQPLNLPNPYPNGKRRPKPLKKTLWSKPLIEHHSLRIDHQDSLTDTDKKMNESFKSST